MGGVLDLSILDSGPDSGSPTHFLAVGRSGDDLVLQKIKLDPLTEILAFRESIRKGLLFTKDRPTPAELKQYGRRLFDFVMQGDLQALYKGLPNAHVRIHLLSNHPGLQTVPWEYWQESHQGAGPRPARSIVRIVPTFGHAPPPCGPWPENVKILLATARPKGQEKVPWVDVRDAISQEFTVRFPQRFTLKVVENVDADALHNAILDESPFDVFHFCGHGREVNGRSQLLLTSPDDGGALPLDGELLMAWLRDRSRLRLVFLSACETATGDFKDEFGVLAAGLVGDGVGAVVANQLPIPLKTVAAFAGRVYKILLKTGDVDLAVSEGRTQLMGGPNETGETASLEWGVPVLYRHFARPDLYQAEGG